ncbi:hypothetical protein [Sphingomonas adhaesiva]|uniref:hypothetical protein n=1 Tax=Sphingomonas adhaesiva TaxID=28212 RepID=UPI002FF4A27E
MFVDFRDTPAPPPWQPPRPQPRLTGRQRRVMTGVIGLNLFLLLVAPIGGATIFAAIAVAFR